MANFCPKCGQATKPEAVFCENCGARLTGAASANPTGYASSATRPPQTPAFAGTGPVREGLPQPGFSDRVNHPEILAAVRKNRKASGLAMFFFVPLPLIGFLVYGLASEDMELPRALLFGGIVSLVFLVFAVIGFLKNRPENGYEAVVTDKYTKLRADKARDGSGSRAGSTDYDYVTVARTTDGKTKKIIETDHGVIWAYEHLKVGDRFRYHPQFGFPYELYDKTKADALYCVSCGAKNPVAADRCKRCNVPLLK